MPAPLTLPLIHRYDSGRADIEVPATLIAGSHEVEAYAKIDTGSTFCVFEKRYARTLGLTDEDGEPLRMYSVNGAFIVYGHELSIRVLDIEHTSVVYFYADDDFGRNVLCRRGWLDRVRLGIVDHDSELYLAPYND